MNLILIGVVVLVALAILVWSMKPRTPMEDPGTIGMQLSDADRQRLAMLVKAGKKIHAIKEFRTLTGAGLAVSKAAVECMAQDPSIGR